MATTSRCEFCVPLVIETSSQKEKLIFEHHASLSDLISCAETKFCHICHLFWASIQRLCSEEHLHQHLSGKSPSGTNRVYDHRMFLVVCQRYGNIMNINVWGEQPHKGERLGYLQICGLGISEPLPPSYPHERGSTKSWENYTRISMTKRWLSTCQNTHAYCGGSHPQSMPTRLVDLGDPSRKQQNPKLLLSEGLLGRYLALSYSWGIGRGIHKTKLTIQNLAAFQCEIVESSMTRTHRESLQIARELGYQYIWIDALCIIQGRDKESRDDWARQAIKIPEIYGNADLTIVAGRSDDSRKGFLKVAPAYSPPVPPIPLLFRSQGTTWAPCYISLGRAATTGPVDKRAWCFQEKMLSRRMIVYGEQEVFFNCREGTEFEDCAPILDRRDRDGWFQLSIDKTLDGKLKTAMEHEQAPMHQTPGFSQADILDTWYILTIEYSKREMFDPLDNFAALSGVTLRFQSALAKLSTSVPRYLAGLWEVDMIRGLLWRRSITYVDPFAIVYESDRHIPLHIPIGINGAQEGREIVRAPSWSWMALQGDIDQLPRSSVNLPINGLQDPSTFRCTPMNSDGTWSPDTWHPGIVKDLPLPFRLEVFGRPRRVRCSKWPASVLMFRGIPPIESMFLYGGREGMVRQTFMLEGVEIPAVPVDELDDGFWSRIIGVGLFDLESESPPEMLWAMCLTTREGLLLQLNDNGSYSRLGVFGIENHEAMFNRISPRKVVLV